MLARAEPHGPSAGCRGRATPRHKHASLPSPQSNSQICTAIFSITMKFTRHKGSTSTIYTKYTITHTHPFNGLLYGTTRVSRYQKVKTNPIWILMKQETVSGSDISWAICKSTPHSTHITTPAPHHSSFHSSFFNRPDALSAIQPRASKH